MIEYKTWTCRCGRTCDKSTGKVEDDFLIVTCECGQRWQLLAYSPFKSSLGFVTKAGIRRSADKIGS